MRDHLDLGIRGSLQLFQDDAAFRSALSISVEWDAVSRMGCSLEDAGAKLRQRVTVGGQRQHDARRALPIGQLVKQITGA